MHGLHWQSAVDFAVLALAAYLLLRWGRQARALRLALVIVGLRVGALVARQLGLVLTGWVLDAATIVALFALFVVFQPEVRRGLMRLDFFRRARQGGDLPVLAAISAAAWSLAERRLGALLVIVRQDSIDELVTAGIPLRGRVSVEILEALFHEGSAVHDGAAVIDGDLISRVGAILPLTQRLDVPSAYGTRHRAGMGLAERSDALIVVVSEERGEVVLMHDKQIEVMHDQAELTSALQALTGHADGGHRARPRWRVRLPDLSLAATALALAACVWSLTFLVPGTSVRIHTVPVELTNVPAGMAVAGQSVAAVDVWLRGTGIMLDSVDLGSVVARLDLSRAHAGANTLLIRPTAIDLPLGLKVSGISPERITVRLAPEAAGSAQ